MKINISLLAILFALIFVLGIATIRGNAVNQPAFSESVKLKATPSSLNKSTNANDKVEKKGDIYNDGSNPEEIAQITKNIEYSFASSAIRPNYINNLDKLAKLVIEEKYVVSLRGHADSVGSYKPNWILSEKRAIRVKDYLISRGVDKLKVITIPFGSTIPIASNKTAEGRQKNRRVEIKLKEVSE